MQQELSATSDTGSLTSQSPKMLVIAGPARFAIAASFVLLLLLGLDCLKLAYITCLRLFSGAPYMLPALMLKMRWTRLHRSTLVRNLLTNASQGIS